MLLGGSFRTVTFFACLLERYLQSNHMSLHWAIQPGVSSGCLEFFHTAEAAQQHYVAVDQDWRGAPGPAITVVQLQIRADHLWGRIQVGTMVLKDGKLKVYEKLVAGTDRYNISLMTNGSAPAVLALDGFVPPLRLYQPGGGAGASGFRLYAGFLKECVRCVDWYEDGMHWSMQPGSYGRITLFTDPKGYEGKYALYQTATSGEGPETEQVVLTMSEQATIRILGSGALVKGNVGKFYMYVKMYAFCYFDEAQEELAYSAARYTAE